MTLTKADLAQQVSTKTDYEKWRYAEIGTKLAIVGLIHGELELWRLRFTSGNFVFYPRHSELRRIYSEVTGDPAGVK